VLDQPHVKTDAGRAEIKARSLPLSRAARNLLLVIDGSKPGSQWLSLVHGVTSADLDSLVSLGLIAPVAPPATAPAPLAPITPPAPAPAPPSERLPEDWARTTQPAAYDDELPPRLTEPLTRAQLYTYLSGEAVKRLGAFKGYTFALEVERCGTMEELQALAVQFVERVHKAKGEAAGRTVRRALGLDLD
jgi:hypothetical protein